MCRIVQFRVGCGQYLACNSAPAGQMAPWLILCNAGATAAAYPRRYLWKTLCAVQCLCLVFSFSAWYACLKLRVMLSENVLSGRLLFVTDVAFGLWAFPRHFRSRCNIRQSVGVGVDGFAGLLQDLCHHFCMRRVWHSHKRACCSTPPCSPPWMLPWHVWLCLRLTSHLRLTSSAVLRG